mgnify:FL=1
MKKHSNFRFLLEYFIIFLFAYLLISGIIAMVSWTNYSYVLCHFGQIYGFLFVYWWIPIPRMCDLEDQNTTYNRNFKSRTNIIIQ